MLYLGSGILKQKSKIKCLLLTFIKTQYNKIHQICNSQLLENNKLCIFLKMGDFKFKLNSVL